MILETVSIEALKIERRKLAKQVKLTPAQSRRLGLLQAFVDWVATERKVLDFAPREAAS